MNHSTTIASPLYRLLPKDIPGYEKLVELALDTRWSWNHGADEIWTELNPELWQLTHNPWVVLQTAPRDRIERAVSDPALSKKVDALVQAMRSAETARGWFQNYHGESPLTTVAYFSMEFMLSEALPIYSGGLGNVAGDQLKAASDLGVPVIGIGLLYSQGYFRQVIDKDGAQQAVYPYNDPGQLPITPLRGQGGEWLRLKIELPGYSIWVRAWHVDVGRTNLLLLDSNDAANYPTLRGITSELYGGGPELRLQQELLLGIGGWRLLTALGIKPEVCHLNEGHAAFAVLERARSFMEETGESFDVALSVTRAGNLFTTHTAVAAGFDRFAPDLIEQYLGGYAELKLGISSRDLLALGRENADDSSEKFNMAYLAARGSSAVNAVSRLHGEVSRRIFEPLFPRWPQAEVPIGYVTNGVHMPSWDSAAADALWTKACENDLWLGTTDSLSQDIRSVSNAELWQFRNRTRESLIFYARERLSQQLAASGAMLEDVEIARHLLDPNALLLGFARRFATYKRPNLLLQDPDRLMGLLTNPARPVQLIIAGKAHPADQAGQDLIRQWTNFIRTSAARQHVIFLSDYDMVLTEHLVQGVDVWLNTPRRPWEASGTSGMKVLVNGGINLSELDGWWAEAYTPQVGWALGDGKEHDGDPAWDVAEAHALYDLLEREVVPEFYTRDSMGIPVAWVTRMRESMAQLTPQYSTNRVVREYTDQHYLPAAARYRQRTADRCAVGKKIVNWKCGLQQEWEQVRFGAVKIAERDNRHQFEVEIFLGNLPPGKVRAQLYAEGINSGEPILIELICEPSATPAFGCYLYRAAVPPARPASDYTARLIPWCDEAAVPLEDDHILWQR